MKSPIKIKIVDSTHKKAIVSFFDDVITKSTIPVVLEDIDENIAHIRITGDFFMREEQLIALIFGIGFSIGIEYQVVK